MYFLTAAPRSTRMITIQTEPVLVNFWAHFIYELLLSISNKTIKGLEFFQKYHFIPSW